MKKITLLVLKNTMGSPSPNAFMTLDNKESIDNIYSCEDKNDKKLIIRKWY